MSDNEIDQEIEPECIDSPIPHIKDNTEKSPKWIYVLAIIYVFVVYFIYLYYSFDEDTVIIRKIPVLLPCFIPFIMGIINLIVLIANSSKLTRKSLFTCSLIIKYSLIPFYVYGISIILAALAFLIVPFASLLAPALAAFMIIVGYSAVLGALPFSLLYLIKSRREKVNGTLITVLAIICQFFFTWDVIAIMILSFKEKRHRVITILAILLFIGWGIYFVKKEILE